MIPFEVAYTRAESPEEAVAAWNDAVGAGEKPVFFGGGTEIVTLARENKLKVNRVIDYKRIPEARHVPSGGAAGAAGDPGAAGDRLVWGSALRLSEVTDGGRFGLLSRCSAGIADRTVRNSITLGGNICGMLPYREAVLPFLLLDGQMETVGGGTAADAAGASAVSEQNLVTDRFNKKVKLRDGELILSLSLDGGVVDGLEGHGMTVSDRGWGPVEAWASGDRGGWYYSRRTQDPRVAYPLVTLVLARLDGEYRLALTGTFGHPVRASLAEAVLNDTDASDVSGLDGEELVRRAAAALDAQMYKYKDDFRGSREYRREVTIQSLAAGIERLAQLVPAGGAGPKKG